MSDQFILTPFFLDRPEDGLLSLAAPGWSTIRPPAASPLPGDDTQARMTYLHRQLATAVAEAVTRRQRPVSVAGDCCVTLGVLAGLQQAGVSPTLIWLDAHGDFNTWETTPSGFLGGMPLAMAVGRGDQTLVAGVGLRPLSEAQVILTDARDLDPGERRSLVDSSVRHLPDAAALQTAPLPAGPLYVHFDADILDPVDAPAMSYPAPGGPPPDALRAGLARLASTGRLAAVSLSTWNPALDADGRSRRLIMSLLDTLLAS